MAPARLQVEVAFSPQAGQVWRWALTLPDGSRVQDALAASGLSAAFPSLDLALHTVGVWGRRRAADAPLRDGDRVEVYRTLLVDPKEARRQRQALQRAQKEPRPSRRAKPVR